MRLSWHRLLTRAPLTGYWYRAVHPRHFSAALAYSHSATSPTRFNPSRGQRPAFPVLYFAENQQLCLFEVAALLGSPLAGQPVLANPYAGALTVFPVRVQLSRVIDLCDPTQLQIIDASIQELTGDWRGYAARAAGGPPQTAPTQRLGAALFARARVEGFVTYSAKDSAHRNLVVFPTRLRTGSLIELVDPATGQGQRIIAGGTITDLP